MIETNSQLNMLFQQAEQCGKTTIQLYKLQGVASLSKLIASCAFMLVMGICLFVALIFMSIGLALFIGQAMSSMFNGFIIVSVFYMVFTFLLYQLGAVSIKRAVRNAIISILLKSNKHEYQNRD